MAKRSDDRSAEGVAGDGGFHAHDHDHCIETALGDAESVCIERGVRLTVLRKRVLEIVWQSHRPLGAYAILDVLAADGRRAAPPTVYRALDFLQENGLVHRIASMNAFVGCPSPGHAGQGQFLICRGCGTAAELVDEDLEARLYRRADALGFRPDQHLIEVTGLCPNCT